MRKKQPPQEELLEKLAPKPPYIEDVEKRLEADGLLGINIGSLEGRFLQWIIASNSIDKILEIGTQYGCSTLWMAEKLGPGGVIYTLEKNGKTIEQARLTFSSEYVRSLPCEISLLEGDAASSLKSIEDKGPFDLVFIDANKSGYLDYYHWAKEFLRPGGYLIADNVFLFNTMFEEAVPDNISEKMWVKMKTFLTEIFTDQEMTTSLVPTIEGLLVATKK